MALLDRIARRPALLLLLHAAAFWPVWRWYVGRLHDGSDEPWAVIALAAALFVTWPASGLRVRPWDPLLKVAAVFTLVYAAAAPFLPPLLRALLAMTALACSWTSLAGARGKLPVVLVLLALSVPVIASLQFYAGYPLRVITAAGATEMLNLAGMDIRRVGTAMESGGRLVLVDAPCSGVRMWWTACLLVCVLAASRERIGWRALALTLALAMPVVLLANASRAAVLFLLETGTTSPPPLAHDLVGMATFALVAMLLLLSESRQRRWITPVPRHRFVEVA